MVYRIIQASKNEEPGNLSITGLGLPGETEGGNLLASGALGSDPLLWILSARVKE